MKDHHTGDHKKAWETRHGDVVKGTNLYNSFGDQSVNFLQLIQLTTDFAKFFSKLGIYFKNFSKTEIPAKLAKDFCH